MRSRPSMMAMMLGRLLTTVESFRGDTCVTLPAGARAADQIEVFAWSRGGFETFRISDGFHDILEDQQA